QAIRRVSVAKGYHPANYALVSFGGAGGQHACSVARSLGVQTVLMHPFAGILSAYGMGHADVRAIRQASILKTLSAETLLEIQAIRRKFEMQTREEILAQGLSTDQLQPSLLSLELRYRETDSSLLVSESDATSWQSLFETEHRRLFGYIRSRQQIEVASMCLELVGTSAASAPLPAVNTDRLESEPLHDHVRIFVNGRFQQAGVLHRNALRP
ncbi:MAG: hydantoinase, partial [Fuerstiella sp.]|nr:hydantoinase [Fuerstiella sp.]